MAVEVAEASHNGWVLQLRWL